MSDRLREFLAEMDRPDRFVRHPAVAVFDEHSEPYWADARTGREVEDPAAHRRAGGRLVKKHRRFGRAELERIASNCNRRTALGDLCPITLGHTDPDQPDETAQPEIVGYARRFRVGYDRRRGKWMLYADYYIRADRDDEARTFPRTSVELWPDPGEEIIDPIALIRRTPQRDLGQWVYSRRSNRRVLRYSREFRPMDDEFDDLGGDLPPAPPGDGGDHTGKLEQFARHCFSHPHAKYLANHYSADAAGDDLGGGMDDLPPPPEGGPGGDPTDLPDADEPDAYMAAPSASNGGLPGGPPPEQYRRDSRRIAYARLQREVAELRQKAATAEARRHVSQLEAEGCVLDAGVEVPAFARLDEAGMARRADHIRRYYRRAPVGGGGRVPLASTPAATPATGELPPARLDAALQYARTHGVGFDEALAKTTK